MNRPKSRREVAVGPVAREGWLHHRKDTRMATWKTRYIKLNGSRFVVYRDLRTMQVKYDLDLKGATVQVITAKGAMATRKDLFRFRLELPDGQGLDWATVSDEDRRAWMEMIERAATSDGSEQQAEAKQISCDAFQEHGTFGFLRCGRCGVKKNEHFKPADIGIGACTVAKEGWLDILVKERDSTAPEEWKHKYGRLKGMVFAWSATNTVADTEFNICLDNRTQLVTIDAKKALLSSTSRIQFSLSTPTTTLIFAVDTAEARQEWVDALLSTLMYVYMIQQTRLQHIADRVAEAEASSSADLPALKEEQRVLQSWACPEPTVSQETDITTSRLEKLASRLDQRSEPYLVTQIEKGVVTKLCNSLNRLVRLPTLSEQEMEVQYAVAKCFRSIMNIPLGMEWVIHDGDALVLLAYSAFCAPRAVDQFISLVSNLLCAASVFSLDGFELVVSTLRAIPSYMRTLPETHNVATRFLRDIDVEGSPFEGVFETLSQEVLSPTTILHVLELLNVLVEIPRERHARLRLRTELEISGFHEIAEAIKLRAAHTTGESVDDMVDLQSEDEALMLPGDEQGDGSSKSSRYLINRKLNDKEAGKAPAVGGRRGSTTPPGASTVTRDTAATIVDRNAELAGGVGRRTSIVPSLGAASVAGQPERDVWIRIVKLIILYMANGKHEQADEDAEFDSHDLQCVLHTLDREALKKHDVVQAKIADVLHQVLKQVKKMSKNDRVLDLSVLAADVLESQKAGGLPGFGGMGGGIGGGIGGIGAALAGKLPGAKGAPAPPALPPASAPAKAPPMPPPPMPGAKLAPPPMPAGGKAAAAKSAPDAKAAAAEYEGPKPEAKMKGFFWEKTTASKGTFWESDESGTVDSSILGVAADSLQALFAQAPPPAKVAAAASGGTAGGVGVAGGQGFAVGGGEGLVAGAGADGGVQFGGVAGGGGVADLSAAPAQRTSVPARKAAPKIPEPSTRLLAGPRAQNVEITMKKLNMTTEELRTVISNCDTDTLGPEKVELLQLVTPEPDEESVLQAYVASGKKLDELRAADRMMCTLVSVPRFRAKIALCNVRCFGSTRVQEVAVQLACLERCVEQLETSRALKDWMRLVVQVGNFMNFGSNRMCGKQEGIRMRSLEKLIQTKSSGGAPYRTLLHYIVSLAQQSARSILPMPQELDALADASRLDLASMEGLLNELEMQLNGAAAEARRCEEESASFPRSVLAAVQQLQDDFTSYKAQHGRVITNLNRVLVLYGEDTSKMPADEWLGTVNNVVRMFERALADNVEAEERAERQRRIRERQQQAALARADPDKAPVRKTRGGARATMSRQFSVSKDANANNGAGMVDSLLSQVRGEKPAGTALDRVKKRNPLQPTAEGDSDSDWSSGDEA